MLTSPQKLSFLDPSVNIRPFHLPNQVLFILANNASPNPMHLLQKELLADGIYA
jgi:hypothetical protein